MRGKVARKSKKNTVDIPYTPKPKQKLFHESNADEVFFGGSKGPGKSHAIVFDAFSYALSFPGSDPHLFRESYDILNDTLIKIFKENVPGELYTFNEQKHEARIINGSVIKFRYCDGYDAALSYDGRSIPYIGVDELTKHEQKTIQQLQSCNRSAKGWPVMFRATGNPGGIGHGWVKGRYVTPTGYGEYTYTDKETNNLIQFIPANVYDGVLTDIDPAYVKRLENLPEAKKKALLYGDWDVFEGQFFVNFGDHLVEKPHFIQPHILRDDNHGTCRVYGSMDYGWGMNGVSSFHYFYVDFDNVIHTLFNWWRKGMSGEAQADDLYDYITSFPWTSGVLPGKVFCDSNMFPKPNLEKEGEKAPIDFFRERFGPKTEFIPANKNRIHGAEMMLSGFDPDPITQDYMFKYWADYNKTAADCMKKRIHDEDRPGDVLKTTDDDWYDSWRYGYVGIKSVTNMLTDQTDKPKPPVVVTESAEQIVHDMEKRGMIGVTGI